MKDYAPLPELITNPTNATMYRGIYLANQRWKTACTAQVDSSVRRCDLIFILFFNSAFFLRTLVWYFVHFIVEYNPEVCHLLWNAPTDFCF